MPDRRQPADAPADASPRRPIVLMFPGLSIMQRQWLSPGMLIVTCPGCGAAAVVSIAAPPTTFVHENDACPILRRIEAAIAVFNSMPAGSH